MDNQPELLFSSPFFRCLQTTEPIAEVMELPIHIERGIGEWYKPDRDVIPEPAPFEVLENFFPGKLNGEWGATVVPSNKGETETDIFDRCREFWPRFIARVEQQYPDVEKLMLVTHAATKIALGMSLLGFSSCREPIDEDGTIIRSGACSLDKYELLQEEEDLPFPQRHWKMTMNGNTEFLSRGEEMHWDFRSGFEAGSDAEVKARSTAAATATDSDDAEDTEHVYVCLDVPNHNYRERHEISHTATLQYAGLDRESPLVKVGENIYEGTWKKLIGTELAFPSAATTKRKTADGAADSLHDENEKSNHDGSTEPPEKVLSERIYRIVDHLELNEVDHL